MQMQNTTSPPPACLDSETQRQVARLLAHENITVQFGNYETAFFDCKNRILGLPSWNFANKHVSDLLIGHEVSHALNTPEDGIDRFKERFPSVPFSICNIIEDIRIERMIMETYPGLLISFRRGYEYFIEEDLFQIDGKDLSTFGFADRLNIRAKTRRTDLAPLNEWEEDFYQRCNAAKTYDEVLDLVEEAVKHIEEEKENKPQPEESQDKDGEATPSSSDSNEDSEGEENPAPEGSYNEESEEESEPAPASPGDAESQDNPEGDEDLKPTFGSQPDDPSHDFDELDSETQRALDSGLQEHQQDESPGDILAATPTSETLLERIVPLAEVQAARKAHARSDIYDYAMSQVADDWMEFKTTSKKHVNILAKEFERRKAAHQYSRATVSRTGQLDVNKLHTYKYDDQIFKSVTSLADAKNHGMIFIIDYSGSMCGQLMGVTLQTIQLVLFCKQVGIPFEVYGFTSPGGYYDADGPEGKLDYTPEVGAALDFSGVHVIELLNSKLKKNEFDTALKELWYQNNAPMLNGQERSQHARGLNPLFSKLETLGGTPLDQTLLITDAIIRRFKKAHRTEKTNVVILTDGDGHRIPVRQSKRDAAFVKAEAEGKRRSSYYDTAVINWNGKRLELDGNNSYYHLVRSLRTIPGVKVVGFYMANGAQNAQSEVQRATKNRGNEKTLSSNRHDGAKVIDASKRAKTKFYEVLEGFGYDAYYVMQGSKSTRIADENLLDGLDQIDASDAKSRSKLARTFAKMGSDKKSSRVFLQKFAEMIA